MWIIWAFGFLALVGLAAISGVVFGAGRKVVDEEQFRRMSPAQRAELNETSTKVGSAVILGIVFLLALVLVLLNSIKIIGANEVGVASTLGTDVRVVGSGVKWVNPVSDITKYPTRPRTVEVTVNVRTADNGYAALKLSTRWAVSRSGADVLFGEFPKKSNDEIESDVVTKNVKAAAAEFYGALTNQQAIDGRLYSQNALGVEQKARLLLTKHGIDTDAVQIQGVDPDGEMTRAINRVNSQIEDTKVAEESVNTAKKQAEQQAAAAQGLKDAAALVSNLTDSEYRILCLQAGERISNGNTQKGIPTYSLPCQENLRTVPGK